MDRHGHNKDICKIFYQEKSYKRIGIGIESYYLLTDALVIAIDHSNPAHHKKLFSELEKRLNNSKTGSNVQLPSFYALKSLGAGTHRYYNHQGFFFEEPDNEMRRERWLIGRDEILIPSTAVAFNLAVNDPKAELIACIAYYIHMIGDIQEGSLKSMHRLDNYRKLLCSFSNDLETAEVYNAGEKAKAFASKIKTVSTEESWVSLTVEKPNYANLFLKRYLRNNVPEVLKELTGKYPRDMEITK